MMCVSVFRVLFCDSLEGNVAPITQIQVLLKLLFLENTPQGDKFENAALSRFV